MFTEEILNKAKDLEEKWHKDCSEAYGKVEFQDVTTHSGIPLKPVYTPLDITGIDFEGIGLPGEYPYTRGINLMGYRLNPWMTRQAMGFGSGEDTRRRFDYLRKETGMQQHVGGEEQLPMWNVRVDLPGYFGYDPDDPKVQGRVGELGCSFCTLHDMELLAHDLPLDKLQLRITTPDPTMVLTALYAVYAERQGYTSEQLPVISWNGLFRQWHLGETAFFPDNAGKLMVEFINYRVKHMPLGVHTHMPGYNPGEAGATPVQELAFSMATMIWIVEECVKAGLDPDEVAPGIIYHLNLGPDFFETIAKIRAYRRMWAKILKERFGCKKPQSLKVLMQGSTSGKELTAREPLNNIIRATIGALTGVLSGVDSIAVRPYDEALGIPTEEASLIAVRVLQILYHETNLPNVADPLGGSYYLEWLTNKIEEEAQKQIDKIEELGGYLKCWKTGFLKKETEKSFVEWQSKIDSGEKVKAGVNMYRVEGNQQNVRIFEYDPKVGEEAAEKARRFKAERDNVKTQKALAFLRETTERFVKEWPDSCGILMPAILDAVRADSTVGEMQNILKEVCGYGFYSG